MTDVIAETKDGRRLYFYFRDGVDRVIFVSTRRSYAERRYHTPKEYERAVRLLEKLARR